MPTSSKRILRDPTSSLRIDITLAGFCSEEYEHSYLQWHDKAGTTRALSTDHPREPQRDRIEYSHLQELVPSLYVAFSSPDPSGTIAQLDSGGTSTLPASQSFTHIITITASPTSPRSSPEFTTNTSPSGTHHLTLPTASKLTQTQLTASLDFLSLALPYLPAYLVSHATHHTAKAVILAPRGRPDLAMQVAVNYLAWASENGVEVVKEVVEEEEVVELCWRESVARC